MSALKIGIVGGGAAGFFAAIRCAGLNPDAEVVILERGKTPLEKVRISGGGRCNVTHACFDPRELTQHYPRGGRELLGPFMRFGPEQTVAWFEARGTPLKAETDGRMFPQSDDSMSVVQCLRREAERLGVILRLQARVERIAQEQGGWVLGVGGDAHKLFFQKILIAAGSSTAIWDLLAALGHRIVPPVPSLFTFNTRDTRLRDLAGISAPETEVAIPNLRLSARGPLLVTHRGLSGPAILRLSAWGARALRQCDYRFGLQINWAAPCEDALTAFEQIKSEHARKTIHAHARLGLPLRLWQNLVQAAGIPPEWRWADAGKASLRSLAAQINQGIFPIHGRSAFKEEFVTAGGVDLREVNFKTFESRLCPSLYFAGEALDIDALTGGFNFQAAWTGGWIAGEAMANAV